MFRKQLFYKLRCNLNIYRKNYALCPPLIRNIFDLEIKRSSYFFNRNLCTNVLSKNTFNGVIDKFNGVTIESSEEPCDQQVFAKKLDGRVSLYNLWMVDSLTNWTKLGIRCIWFKIKLKDSTWVPILAERGFNFHHAREEFVMMYKWLPKDSTPNLPPSCHTNLGVGALVLNDKSELLAVSEKHYDYPHWKLPGGYVERGEDIVTAAVREVKEETGVESVFQSVITLRHTHNMMYGNSDIYVLVRLQAITEKITTSQREIKDCKWMSTEEFVNHPHVHEFNRFIIGHALEHKSKGLKLDIQKQTVKWATFVRTMNFLIVTND